MDADQQVDDFLRRAQKLTLFEFVERSPIDGAEALNALQDSGIISDLAVNILDVPACDQVDAVRFLRRYIAQNRKRFHD